MSKGVARLLSAIWSAMRCACGLIASWWGECRGGETLDMLQAMNTGHDGSLTTAHANSPRDLLSRLEVMTLMAGMELPLAAVREQIASAVNLIVQQARFPAGPGASW